MQLVPQLDVVGVRAGFAIKPGTVRNPTPIHRLCEILDDIVWDRESLARWPTHPLFHKTYLGIAQWRTMYPGSVGLVRTAVTNVRPGQHKGWLVIRRN